MLLPECLLLAGGRIVLDPGRCDRHPRGEFSDPLCHRQAGSSRCVTTERSTTATKVHEYTGFPRSRPDDRRAGLQSLADPARRAGGPPLHRRGLRLQRLQRAADARRRDHRVDRGRGLDDPAGRLDLLDRADHARALGGALRPVGRARRAAEDDVRQRLLLLRRPADRQPGRLAAQHLGRLPGLRRHRRDRAGPRLHLAGLDAGEMVPRPAGHGDRHGDHGLRRRRPDRRPAGRGADGPLPVVDVGGREGGVPGDGLRLLRLHDVRRVHRPGAGAGLAARGIRAARAAEEARHARPRRRWTSPGRRRSSGCSGRCSA